jgi:hypothetical protein
MYIYMSGRIRYSVATMFIGLKKKRTPFSQEDINTFLQCNHIEIWNTTLVHNENTLREKFRELQIQYMDGSLSNFRVKSFFIAMDIGYSSNESMYQQQLHDRYGLNLSRVACTSHSMPIHTWQVVVQCKRYLVVGKLGLDVCHEIPPPSMIAVIIREGLLQSQSFPP